MRFMESLKTKKADVYRPFSFLNGLFTADPMFFKPGFEGRIFGSGGGVAASAGVADAEELFLDGRAAVEIVFYLHVVAGAKPAVGVAVSCTPGLWYCQCDVIVV